ncbi:MAG: TetR/AcrR family transcriptional regulator; helix-turn-helix transcriptional regulator [Candidatus Cyclonatronum sp.]|uniref:TetR/AcrR family transcriptional regulator n=1 Tax=Cyclonatronum sp. TaxID=3024185 RepID=UPI0025BE2A85|nr:TetR/AcrR family transcriptional regulator [Cyclonatronum sp.]MCH8487726.1 TetR/AcrR family transcriptional regulator; helix-turn-helix transcriptional regulator [Cyclonatronum sp.]
MPTTERKKRERENRRNTIVEATERLITERGFESITMDDIAEASEVSKGTLYLYFRNKSEIALAMHTVGMQEMLNRIAGLIATSGTGLEIIQNMGRLFVDFARENDHYFKCMVYLESMGFEAFKGLKDTDTFGSLQDSDRAIYNYIRRAIQIGIQDGSIDAGFKPDLLPLQIMMTVRGMMQFIIYRDAGLFMASGTESAGVTLESLLDDYAELLTRALRPSR